MADCIMLQGTGSHVGKSILATALCRIFYREGRRVAPFKAQNMALNSYVTKKGLEMGRAQVAQAEAAGLDPSVDMNPVLLKPTGNSQSQVILMGKPVGNMSAREYHKGYSLRAFDTVKEALGRLTSAYDTIVIEGAGSPAEVNLKANDIVNMRVAKYLKAPVLLVADIDRGGALASLVGTLELLEDDERDLVKGLIVNKFRGDVSLFDPAVEFLEKKTGKPVLGIVPYIESMGIDDEDSVSLEEKSNPPTDENRKISIGVIRLPKISNFTDFDCLGGEPDVSLSYVSDPDLLSSLDLIILPGSKNTSEDLLYLKKSGMERALKERFSEGMPIIGICGGYQMLGQEIRDPYHSESETDSIEGIGLLPIRTVFEREKFTSQAEADCINLKFLGFDISQKGLLGYEIHMGHTEFLENGMNPFTVREISEDAKSAASAAEGCLSEDGRVFGTYIHGLFDHDGFRLDIINALRRRKGLPVRKGVRNLRAERQRNYDRLADTVEKSLNMELLRRIMGNGIC